MARLLALPGSGYCHDLTVAMDKFGCRVGLRDRQQASAASFGMAEQQRGETSWEWMLLE
jgi:hypothetical protein